MHQKMTKQQKLQKVNDEIVACPLCPIDKTGKPVPGEGNADADIVFIGEAPGKKEAESGRPFIGRSGQLLRLQIRESGLQEEDVYITSPVKYLPLRPARNATHSVAGRGTPTPADIAHGKTHLDKQLTVIDPKIIVLLGNTACQGVLGEKIPVMKEHGKIIERNGKKYFIMLHPAAAIRFQKFKSVFVGDFQKLKQLLK